ncbi:MAG TPA: cation:proton antiporter, partial [Acidobacteriota bacterium]|nr:cation:proton antiporter [Acidobacteriota bacterium]
MPHELPLIRDLLVLLTSSIVVSLICFRIRVPMLIGFMLTGILIGPHGLGLIRDVHAVEILAEIGVVLLLFTVGLEFSLKSLFEMRKIVVNGGGLQVVATTAVVTLIFWMAGKPLNQGIFYGFLCTLSSTALVLKTYADRAETDTPHGRIGLGVLLFQDLCVVPMMLLVPI